jgi:hypothetical protein
MGLLLLLRQCAPGDRDAALALLRKWRDEPPVMTEEEWQCFAEEFDKERRERPLFAQYRRAAR